MNRCWIGTVVVVLELLAASSAVAEVRLPHVIGDHMVLQRNVPLNIWGWAGKRERVTVELGEGKVTTRANSAGQWKVALPAMKAGGPHTMTVKGSNTLTIKDILVGEVWIGSGQSNMQMNVAGSANAAAEIAAAKYPKMRLFLVPNVLSGIPNRDVNANWKECSPASVPSFSAVLYYFGRHLHKELDVPVGLIASAWGGSLIEPWTPPVGFAGVKGLSKITQRVKTTQLEYLNSLAAQLRKSRSPRRDVAQWLLAARKAAVKDALLPSAPAFAYPAHPLAGWPEPTSMYNAMINPVVPFSVRGAIWYQGESNLNDGMLYRQKMKALVEGWRKVFGNDRLSFYWTQLAPFNYGGDPLRLPRIWEAQQTATSIPHTGMAVITDIGNLGDIHPRNKQDVGKRLALWALAKDYKRDLVYSGPIYKSMKVEGGKVRVRFDHVGSGLESRDGKPLTRFEIAGAGEFFPAQAVIDGKTVVVSSEKVAKPTAVRFGWHQLSEPNLRNKEGLPAGSFRTTSTTPTIKGRRLFISATSVKLECLESDGVIRYTLDGSLPGETSQAFTKDLRLDETATVRARFFRNGGANSAVAQVTFTRVKPRKHNGITLVPGLRYEYYLGQ
ncbi:MAG: chitobiase/beta-hexosaminidase C-terminal domain-containing protein, partial [Planctomycetes bacterium]|nr:chitobiase/beta-hexosaminidase C-terminal domain-containing protein [Planctomycetota bacterium]